MMIININKNFFEEGLENFIIKAQKVYVTKFTIKLF